MRHYLSIDDISDPRQWVSEALDMKAHPLALSQLGSGKTLGLIFFNSSLRTRMSLQKAAQNVGLHTIIFNVGADGWRLEFEDGAVMNGDKAEHIKEAAQVLSQYCDIIGVRAFAKLENKYEDELETVIQGFVQYGSVPIINLESALSHPLQALADMMTMYEYNLTPESKVVLSWAPHPKALPHAVANSFVKMMQTLPCEFVITHPEGYDLDPRITKKATISTDQEEACAGADFIYVKNWSSYQSYGQVTSKDPSWMMTMQKLDNAKFMHCLPVRRNVVVEDAVLDSQQSLVIQQANNRIWSAQCVLSKILKHGSKS